MVGQVQTAVKGAMSAVAGLLVSLGTETGLGSYAVLAVVRETAGQIAALQGNPSVTGLLPASDVQQLTVLLAALQSYL